MFETIVMQRVVSAALVGLPGWSNETTLMGTPDSHHDFKHTFFLGLR